MMSTAHTISSTSTKPAAKIELERYDYAQLFTGNAYQTAYFLHMVYGFTLVAYAGLETGMRSQTSYALVQGDTRLMVTTPLDPSSPMAHEVRIHGDAVGEVAFTVRDAAEAFNLALLRGACPVAEPVT